MRARLTRCTRLRLTPWLVAALWLMVSAPIAPSVTIRPGADVPWGASEPALAGPRAVWGVPATTWFGTGNGFDLLTQGAGEPVTVLAHEPPPALPPGHFDRVDFAVSPTHLAVAHRDTYWAGEGITAYPATASTELRAGPIGGPTEPILHCSGELAGFALNGSTLAYSPGGCASADRDSIVVRARLQCLDRANRDERPAVCDGSLFLRRPGRSVCAERLPPDRALLGKLAGGVDGGLREDEVVVAPGRSGTVTIQLKRAAVRSLRARRRVPAVVEWCDYQSRLALLALRLRLAR